MKSSRQAHSNEGTTSQYHHYIPRFILRNFAHSFEPPKNPNGPKKRGKRKWKKGCYPGDPMLNTINLAGTTAEIVEAPISNTFGQTDMYRDFADATNQNHLEQQFSRLESRAAEIITRIRKEHEVAKLEIWLSRAEKDTLRKFLFIMKYRSLGFHKRFYHETAEGYSEDDKTRLVQYMREKGYQKPIDIWFDNINAMLDMKMDLEDNWMDELMKRMYPDDAQWLIAHIKLMYLAFCTPSGQDDEFLLTENAYSIFEGPNSYLTNPDIGESTAQAYTEYHVFAAVSPKLIIVLRSLLLPIPEEDSNDAIRQWRETMYEQSVRQHINPLEAGSSLADLPVTKARNSYAGVVNDADKQDWSPRWNHKFCFKFFPISAEHVNKINCIMLEEAQKTSAIAFKSQHAARKMLEYYLSMPFENRNSLGDRPDDQRLAYMKKLEHAVRKMGSNISAAYHTRKSKMQEDRFDLLGQMLEECSLKEVPTMKPYMRLGGSALTMPKDLDQASKMLNMRIKIDVWSRGVDENIRIENREKLRQMFCQLPARRMWFYLKHTRRMLLTPNEPDKRTGFRHDVDDIMEGPEDIIANACQLFRTQDLCRLMYFATLNHIHLTKTPDFDLAAEISLDLKGARSLHQIKALAFGSAGSICDCGIEVIENKARLIRDKIQAAKILNEHQNPFWTKEENLEMATRIVTRDQFSALLGETLSPPDLELLKGVLFGTVYPSKNK